MHLANHVSQLKLMEILNRLRLFKSLSPIERELISETPNLLYIIPKNEVFITYAQQDDSFYILLNGSAKVTRHKKVISKLFPGDFIGEVGFICNEPRSASVTACSTVLVMKINRDIFLKLPSSIRERVKDKIILGLVERINKQSNKISQYESILTII